jgi:hypothetical protein
MLTSATVAMPINVWPLTMRSTAPLLPPLLEVPAPPGDVPLAVLPLEGADGTNVALGLEIQDVAAAFAAEVEVDARGLTEPFPAKLQAWPSRLLSSYHSLMTNESFMALMKITISHESIQN